MQTSRAVRFAERGCLTILFVWLVWLPLPFGSIIPAARMPLVAVPLALCLVAALLRLHATRDRSNSAQPTAASQWWGFGALVFLAIVALQLVPLPPSLLKILSAESFTLWESAANIARLAGQAPDTRWPLTVDPQTTLTELVRLVALFAAFTSAVLLVRTHPARRMLAVTLCATAVFQSLYGIREAALQRYEIWGWVNRLIFDRITGTFVNPNHFAHYLAIIVPMALFLLATLWRKSGSGDTPLSSRLAQLLEHHILLAGFTLLAIAACVAAILLAQSRGALVALVTGVLAIAAMLPGRRTPRLLAGLVAGVALIVALALFLGPERTIGRFAPDAIGEQAGGRRFAIATTLRLWQRFPLFGSGAGTYERVVSMEQNLDTDRTLNRAHNDYLEIASTTGAIGLAVALGTLLPGLVALFRMTFGPPAEELTFRRRAFQGAALMSLAVAMVHALFDFNFFIPANPATLAVIVGAAVAALDHDKRTHDSRTRR